MTLPGGSSRGDDRRLAGNTLWLMTGEIVSKLASIVLVVIVARAIGVREYGFFTFAGSFVPLFLIIGSLGVHQVVVRRLVEDNSQLSELFASGLLVRVVTGVAALAASMALAPWFLDDSTAILTVLVVGAALLLDAITSFMSAVFEAFERNRYYATALVVNRVGSTALAVAVFVAGGGLPEILVTYFTGSLIALGYATRSLRRNFPPIRLRAARRSTAVALVREGAPLGLAGVLNMALFRLDAIMVAAFLGAEAVGLYGIAFRFLESFLFVAFSLGDACFPRYARQGRGPQSARTVQVATALALTFYLPLLVLSLFAAPWMVTTLFGARYALAAQAVPWLTLAAVFFAVTYQARSAAVAVGGRSSIAAVAAAALVFNIALNVVLIPRYGITGAAIGTAAAAALESLLSVLALRRLGVASALSRLALTPAFAAGATFGLLHLTDLADAGAILAGAACYLLALIAVLSVLAPRERSQALALLRRPAGRDGTR